MPAARLIPFLAAASLVGGCSSPPGGFDSPEPAARLNAILDADASRDRSAIPHLIESLNHDDPLVRMAAIRTLEDLTAQTHGYRYWAPEPERREAIQAWLDWYRQNSGVASRQPAASSKASSADNGGEAP